MGGSEWSSFAGIWIAANFPSTSRITIRSSCSTSLSIYKQPAQFMDQLRCAAACKRPEIVLTTANVGFLVTRLMLLFGHFNYGKKGILDATHTRLFTFRSLTALLEQSGYKIHELRGIPAPFPKAIGNNFLSRLLLRLNSALIASESRSFFLSDFCPRPGHSDGGQSAFRNHFGQRSAERGSVAAGRLIYGPAQVEISRFAKPGANLPGPTHRAGVARRARYIGAIRRRRSRRRRA